MKCIAPSLAAKQLVYNKKTKAMLTTKIKIMKKKIMVKSTQKKKMHQLGMHTGRQTKRQKKA